MLEGCNLPFDFTQGYSLEIVLSLRKDFGTFKQCLDCDKTVIDCDGDF